MERQLMIDHLIAAVNLYGIVPYEEAAGIFSELNGYPVSEAEIREVAEDPETEGLLYRGDVVVHRNHLEHMLIDKFEAFDEYWSAIEGHEYYVPELDGFLRFADPRWLPETPAIERLREFAAKELFDGDNEEVEGLLYVVKREANAPGDPESNLASSLISLYGESAGHKLKQLLRMADEAMEDVRRWKNCGYTNEEVWGYNPYEEARNAGMLGSGDEDLGSIMDQMFGIQPSQPVTVEKIGRNEPCTCGSGKKYKKFLRIGAGS